MATCRRRRGRSSCRSSKRRRTTRPHPPSARTRSLDLRALRDDDRAFVRDEEAAAILLAVVADDRLRRDLDVLVDDGPLDLHVAADLHAVEEDALFHFRK